MALPNNASFPASGMRPWVEEIIWLALKTEITVQAVAFSVTARL
jgi:hypothetical protein